MLKTAQNWHYSLEGMLQYEGDTSVKDTQEKKPGELSYQEYLRLFLAAEGEEKKVLRMMDIVEMHLQTEDASFIWQIVWTISAYRRRSEVNMATAKN